MSFLVKPSFYQLLQSWSNQYIGITCLTPDNDFIASTSSIGILRVLGITFIATSWPVFLLLPFFTTPKEPRPNVSKVISNLFILFKKTFSFLKPIFFWSVFVKFFDQFFTTLDVNLDILCIKIYIGQGRHTLYFYPYHDT